MKFSLLRSLTTLTASLAILSLVSLNADAQQGIGSNWFGEAYSRSGSDVQSMYNSNAQRPLGGLFAPGFTRTLTILGGLNFPLASTEEIFASQVNASPDIPTFAPIGIDSTLDDSGYAVSFAFGRRHSNVLRSEIEGAFRSNDINSIISNGPIASEEQRDGSVDVVSIMKNFIFEFDNSSRFTPYVGAGLGISYIDVELGEVSGSTGGIVFQEDQTLFSYQAIGGVATRLTSAADFIVEYRFFGTAAVEFEELGQDLTYNTNNLFFGVKFEY